MTTLYRAVVVCTQDPCTYCDGPAERHVQALTWPTFLQAKRHAEAMSRNVYGASVHDAEVECAEVSEWTPVNPLNPIEPT